ncbi:hypothetical protein ACA910_018110 [Epithemia clementina (nom. ined.)]
MNNLYGGLFGDLPAAKNASSDDDKMAKPETGATSKSPEGGLSSTNATTSAPSYEQKKRGVDAITTAFVPSVARARRKAPHNTSTTVPARVKAEKQPQGARNPLASSMVYAAHKTETIAESQQEKTVTNVHELLSSVMFQSFQSDENNTEPGNSHVVAAADEHSHVHEKLIEDPYDPMVPNDLLQYWQRKNFEKERINLEKERQQALQQQELLREHLRKEREELARAGDLEKLAQRSMGRGRGRGISNLPAWMVEKEKRAASTEVPPPDS